MTGLPVWDGFQPCYNRRLSADQATFANVQTAITGLSFPVTAAEEWDFHLVLSCTMVLATGVKFYFTFPAGTIGDMHLGGNVATLPTWQTLYAAVLTVPGTFFITGAITGQYVINGRLLVGVNSGTVQLVGITGGATTTCAVKRGSVLRASRISP